MTSLRHLLILFACAPCLLPAEVSLALENPGFEEGARAWSMGDDGMGSVVADAARQGTGGLRVVDRSAGTGSNIRATSAPADPGRAYAVRFWARPVHDAGVGVYIQFQDAAGTSLNTPDRKNEIAFTIPGAPREWKQYTLVGVAPPKTAALSIWVHSYNGSIASACLDDFTVAQLTEAEAKTVRTTPTATGGSSRTLPIPDPTRIDEIAALLPEHPAGLCRPAANRVAWDALRKRDAADRVVSSAERLLDEPPPAHPDELYLEFTTNGNRTNYQRPYGRASSRIQALVVAECLEGNGRFIPAIVRDMTAMCEHRSWVMPAHDSSLSNFKGTHLTIDLGSSARAWMLAESLHVLGDRLPAATRSRVLAEIRRRVWTPYLEALRAGDTRGNWWMRGTNNWNAVCSAGLVGSALAAMPPRRERAEVLAGMEIANPYFLSGFTADGYCSEGMGYWNYGFGHYMMMGIQVRRATQHRLDIFRGEKLQKIAAFPLNIMVTPTMAPAFADCSVRARPSNTILTFIDSVYPDLMPGDWRTASPVRGSIVETGFLAFGGHVVPPGESHTPAPLALPIRSWFEEAGILVSRSGPDAGERGLSTAIKGGHNAEHHNHNDVGSYLIAAFGHAYLLDPGGETYTRRTFSRQRYVSQVLNSYGHPVPRVDETLQTTGRASRARMLETTFSDDVDELVMDISDAYPVPRLEKLVRRFRHDRAGETITIEDQVTLSEPKPFETALITYDRVHCPEDGSVIVYNTRGAVRVDVVADGGSVEVDREAIENPGCPSPTRIAIRFSDPVATASVRMTVRATDLTPGLPGVYVAPDETELAPKPAEAVTVQAEALTAESGGTVTVDDKVGASGKALKFWDDVGHALSWTVSIPAAGRYGIQIRCCHGNGNAPVTRRVQLDGTFLDDPEQELLFPYTGGWSSAEDNWQTVWLAQGGKALTVDLSPGTHTITMINTSGNGLNLDWLRCVPVAAGAAAD